MKAASRPTTTALKKRGGLPPHRCAAGRYKKRFFYASPNAKRLGRGTARANHREAMASEMWWWGDLLSSRKATHV